MAATPFCCFLQKYDGVERWKRCTKAQVVHVAAEILPGLLQVLLHQVQKAGDFVKVCGDVTDVMDVLAEFAWRPARSSCPSLRPRGATEGDRGVADWTEEGPPSSGENERNERDLRGVSGGIESHASPVDGMGLAWNGRPNEQGVNSTVHVCRSVDRANSGWVKEHELPSSKNMLSSVCGQGSLTCVPLVGSQCACVGESLSLTLFWG